MDPEASAIQENVVNERHDTMTLAINRVMGNQEQSYDDFIGGFQYITKDDMKQSIINSARNRTEAVTQKKNHLSIQPQGGKRLNCNSPSDQAKEETICNYLEEEDLEEEVLGCGIKTTEKNPNSGATRLQFDNFVDEDALDDEPSSYVASFGQANSGSGSENSSLPPQDKECCKEDHSIDTKDENSSFLPPDNTNEPDAMSHVVVDQKNNTTIANHNTDDVNSLDSEGHNIEILGNGKQEVTLFPGEAEPQSEIDGKELTNHTHLDFAVVTCLSCDPVDQTESSLTDEVQPFSLDDDFDYDNVTLTPKFTPQEVQHLKSFLPANVKVQ